MAHSTTDFKLRFIGVFLTLFLLIKPGVGFSQDLMSLIDTAQLLKKEIKVGTFKSTRLVNCPTIEVLGPRTLDVRISHRFGSINSGSENAWGIDGPANIRLALEYSYNGRLMAGVGRSSFEKMVDGFLKYRLLRQTVNNNMPVSLTLMASGFYTAQKDPNKDRNGFDKYKYFSNRLSFVNQLLVARKFNSRFSLQLGGWFAHYNLVDHARDNNDVFGATALTRIMLSRSVAMTFEYAWRGVSDYSENDYYDSMGIGFEIETGGHVFQIHVTNSFGIADNQYLTRSNTKWDNAGIRIGFNVSRVFTL